jgi:hypothetical protein
MGKLREVFKLIGEAIRGPRAVVGGVYARPRSPEDDAQDFVIQMYERSALPCEMCDDIGEPHACQRGWWRQQLAHFKGGACSDPECSCQPCSDCGRVGDLPRQQLLDRLNAGSVSHV